MYKCLVNTACPSRAYCVVSNWYLQGELGALIGGDFMVMDIIGWHKRCERKKNTHTHTKFSNNKLNEITMAIGPCASWLKDSLLVCVPCNGCLLTIAPLENDLIYWICNTIWTIYLLEMEKKEIAQTCTETKCSLVEIVKKKLNVFNMNWIVIYKSRSRTVQWGYRVLTCHCSVSSEKKKLKIEPFFC